MYVSEATVNKVCRIFKKWGCVRDPFAGRVGRRKIFTRQDMLMEQRIGKVVSIPTLWRSLQFCGITRKKIQKAAKERSEALRGFYLYNIGIHYTSEQLIFIDEIAKDERTLTRLYGYSPINTRVKKNVVFVRGKRYTIVLRRFYCC
ncbi:uncharacterized protein OCT59_007409 [Rhizophagus irregularis]|uniref:uncharacterized protein n=1 Tax=Rhizophagus irregularis TaxID=588596 RepID=UPI0019D8D2AF|nr:hypothetical protein OCT59_007409 [Rhizophagus irregularis]GET62151.1 homeodomain-like protein [Rhizophagus irregularis DAOM 181602=DAOM 197198]